MQSVEGAATPAKLHEKVKPQQEPQPNTPPRAHKSKRVIKRLQSDSRSGSLNDEKVLFQTQLVRSQSTFKFLDNFLVEQKVGESRQSKVFRVRHRTSGQHFALKRSARRFSTKAHRDSYLRELSAVSSLVVHPNIVSYYRAWQQDKYVYIQMELCEGGSLAEQIYRVRQNDRAFEEQRLVEILSDLCQGLEFVHSQHILHLDIKPDNIFLDAEDRCKIGDFGLAVGDQDKVWEEGDGAYLAPELLKAQNPDSSADIYSAGASLFECCTGMRLPDVKENLPHIDLGVSEGLRDILLQMLHQNPESRPSAADINQQIARMYAEHPEWNAPMERVASICSGTDCMTEAQNSTSTPSVSPVPTFGGWQPHHNEQEGSYREAVRQGEWRGDDTAFCARKNPEPDRDQWSRRTLQFASDGTPLHAEEDAQPRFTVPRPFTAMRSPFAEASFQKWVGGPSSPLSCQSASASSGSPQQSHRLNKSSEMEDLQSTVRCLNMC